VDIEDLHLNSLLRTKVRTTQMLSCVDIALNALEEDYDNKNKIDVYEAFYYYYIHNMNYTEVANKLYTTTSTAQRWVSEVTRKLSVLLWGVEAFGI
ncbi:MAG: helix-turn-helix domain-containing protein, partial [Clostridiales bacterium]|nr:helix-turn-helix domain-containing protein [Clostridiales bacterium]